MGIKYCYRLKKTFFLLLEMVLKTKDHEEKRNTKRICCYLNLFYVKGYENEDYGEEFIMNRISKTNKGAECGI
jgi:glycerol-3-phosphate responsive antiterminator